ncbi:MAG: hypothetical protein KAW92_08660 [Candidatus Cloacimonetes bacterium]|nr:hypothetical protein [Candidatus Cloacimonadota bacterium]
MATIFIGLGGTGVNVVTRIKEKYSRFTFTKVHGEKEVIFHGIDIDNPNIGITQSIDFTQVSISNPQDVINTHWKDDDIFKKWWKEGYYPECALVSGNAAGKHRANGRIIFWHNFNLLRDELEKVLRSATRVEAREADRAVEHKIYLINSSGGGTGAGMFIDVGFLLRNLIGTRENYKLFSVLIHGNIWEKAGYKGAKTVAFGALTELERWMERPQEYEMKYFDCKLPTTKKQFNRLFDMVFLLDETNLDGRVFIPTGNQALPDQYMDFASWLLFTLSIPDTKVCLQNIISFFGHLDETHMKEKTKRALRYGSAAVSLITVPYEEISNWVKGAFINEFYNGFERTDLEDTTKILKQLKIYEEDAGQLSNELKSHRSYKELINYAATIASDVGSSRNLDTFNYNLTEYNLTELNGIRDRMSIWKSEINRFLLTKKDVFRNEISTQISSNIQQTFDFTGILQYLENLTTKIEFQINKVETKYQTKVSYSIRIEHMNNIIKNLGEFPTNPTKFFLKRNKFRGLIDEWIAYSGFRNIVNPNTYLYAYTSDILLDELKTFYHTLREIVQNRISQVESVKAIYEKLQSKYQELKARYHYDKSNIIDPEKFEKKEYPLLLSVPIEVDDLKNVIKDLQQKDIDNQLKLSLWSGMSISNKELKGINFYYQEIYADLAETKGRNLDKIIINAVDELDNIIQSKLNTIIEETVNKYFRIDHSLRKYFQGKHKEYNGLLSYPEEKAKFIKLLSYEVGSQTIGALEDKKLSEEEWINIALKGFFKSLGNLVKPFWSFSNEEKRKEFRLPELNQEFPAIFRHPDLDLPLDVFNNQNDMNSDQFRLILFSYQFGAPLYLLNTVKDSSYELYKSGKASTIPFGDMRFLNEWKDDIEKPSRFAFSDFLFLMALGFRIIHRAKKGKAKGKTYYYGETNLGRITEAMYKIRDKIADNIKEEIKLKIRKEIYDISLSGTDQLNKYNGLLVDVDKQLDSLKPPKTKGNITAYNIWTHLKEKVKVKRLKNGEVSSYDGKFYCDSKSDMDAIIKEHTGISGL